MSWRPHSSGEIQAHLRQHITAGHGTWARPVNVNWAVTAHGAGNAVNGPLGKEDYPPDLRARDSFKVNANSTETTIAPRDIALLRSCGGGSSSGIQRSR